ncbi:MAG: carbohydrate-binding protein [Bacteroidota bacterium]
MNQKLLLLFLCLLLTLPTQAQEFLKTNGKAIVNTSGDTIILRGMGLGGWMLQEGYMLQTAGFANAQHKIREKVEQLIGPANTDAWYDAWYANHVRKIDIDSLKAWGFNSVRLPMHYNLFTLPIEDEPVAGQNTWLSKGFEMTDSLISWCKQNDMYVILDLHAAPGGQGYDEGISDYDPNKPSLWESQENRDKTVALWKRLAETYVNEPTVAGYDLLNETNWNMSGNTPLRDLYFEITDSIRAVDTSHIIIIEGNWFANDFTGLTPPWDDNMVYSPHKYWSVNDQASIQWVLDMRETYNVPLYLGESGENSNVWFRDAIRLLEDNDIGWAWWPMKKVESIAGPLSAVKNQGYQDLLDYWDGNGSAPSAAVAQASLMQLTENLKLENCVYQKDVIDAMFRQVYSNETKPFNTQDIPGIIYTTDFDMGVVGEAYWDNEVANYQVTTGNFTSWNNGWAYRNDGVDLQKTDDILYTNGYNVGWLSNNEWMQYDVSVAASAVYDVEIRFASIGTDGRFHLEMDGADITGRRSVPNTGDWQNWQTVTVSDVILDANDSKLRFYVDVEGFNLGGMKFTQKGATTTLPTEFQSAVTLDDQTVQLNLNKPLSGPLPASPANFSIFVNGGSVPISAVNLDPNNPRIITFTVNHSFKSSELIKISYSGNQIDATDGTTLNTFSQRDVQNTVAIIHAVPGKVQAEDYYFQVGVQLENTTDAGGGQNIGFLDAGDYLDYYINVGQNGTYNVAYRTAAESEMGAVQMQLIDPTGAITILDDVTFPSTGGWQTWTSTNSELDLPAGEHQLRMLITQPLFNMNWFEFTFLTEIERPEDILKFKLFPNPNDGLFELEVSLAERQNLEIIVSDLLGHQIQRKSLAEVITVQERLDLRALPKGYYLLRMRLEDGSIYTQKLLIH